MTLETTAHWQPPASLLASWPMGFKDLFSKQAGEYARYRPTYPASLFEYVAGLAGAHELAWDCGTGNGQAARGLAPFFKNVIATDPSESQLAQAPSIPNVEYRVARAETAELADRSVDLVTVAQALHWFQVDRFYEEVKRVLKPGGAIAVWSYALGKVSPEIDPLLEAYYHDIIGKYWEPERRLVDSAYRTLPFPFAEIEPPDLAIAHDWDLDRLLGYLYSWSATQTAIQRTGKNPLEDFAADLGRVWGDRATKRRVTWPLALRAGTMK